MSIDFSKNENPYENTTLNDQYAPPKPTENISTLAVAIVVLFCLALFVVLGVVLMTSIATPSSSPVKIWLALGATILVPLIIGWTIIWWLRGR